MRLARGRAFDSGKGEVFLHSFRLAVRDAGHETRSEKSYSFRVSRLASRVTCLVLNHSPPLLIQLDRLEQGFEVAFAEAFVAFALDDLEEDWADDILRENLEQHALPFARVAVKQNASLLERAQILAVPGYAGIDLFVVRLRRVLKLNAVFTQSIHGRDDVFGRKRDMLNPFATIFAQVLFDLRLVVLRFVDGNLDLAARTRQRATKQSGLLAFDIEIANLAEIEQTLVKRGPVVHPSACDVVREVVNHGESRRLNGRFGVDGHEVDVVNRVLPVAVDKVNQTAADAFDRRN